MMNKKIALIYLVMSLTSCSFYTYFPQTGAQKYAATNASSVKIYSNDVDQSYEIIGSVAADVIGDGIKAANYLKKEAAKQGADAIIHVKLSKINSVASRVGISGVAIKFK